MPGDDFIWLISSLCRVNRCRLIPRCCCTGEGRVGAAAFPCIGFLKGESPRPFILVKSDGERLLSFEAGSQKFIYEGRADESKISSLHNGALVALAFHANQMKAKQSV